MEESNITGSSDDSLNTSTFDTSSFDANAFIHTLPITPLMRQRGYTEIDKQASDMKPNTMTNNVPPCKDDGDTTDLDLGLNLDKNEIDDGEHSHAKDGHNHGVQMEGLADSKEHQCLACEMNEIINTAVGSCGEGGSEAVKVPHTCTNIADALGISGISGQSNQKADEATAPSEERSTDNLDDPKDGKKYLCFYCQKGFSRKDSRKRHERIHTQDRPHKCSHCEKTFIAKCHQKSHEIIHTGIKEFKCDYCGKAFHRMDQRNFHEKSHLKDNQTVPVSACSSKVEIPIDDQKSQIVLEGGVVKYICRFCPKNFPRIDSRKRHERTHTGQKPHKCVFCEHSFVTAYHKRLHERVHTKEKPHTCVICKKGFSRMDSLKRHEKLHE